MFLTFSFDVSIVRRRVFHIHAAFECIIVVSCLLAGL